VEKNIQQQRERRHNMSKLTKRMVEEAIKESGGIISHIAQKCRCSWHTVRNFIHSPGNEDLLEQLTDETEMMLDKAEERLYFMTTFGDHQLPAIKFLLLTKGKHRGYTYKQEQEKKGKQEQEQEKVKEEERKEEQEYELTEAERKANESDTYTVLSHTLVRDPVTGKEELQRTFQRVKQGRPAVNKR
jgi:flagellar biosynthesis component FlhA